MLVLPIKKKWLEMIISGEKKEEYREIKPYYNSRFQNYFCNGRVINKNLVNLADKEIIFRNGYEKTSLQVKCLVHLTKGEGKKEWGAIPGENYYILRILKILEIKNVNIIKDVSYLKRYVIGRENCNIYITDYCRYEIMKLPYEESYDFAENIKLRNINIIVLEGKCERKRINR